MKDAALLIAALAWLLCSCQSTGAHGSNLISRDKPAAASSEESPQLRASNAVDGDPATRWSSKAFDPQWIMIDLEKPHRITSVRLVWEKAFGREYEIQVSDDTKKWKPIYYTANGRGGIENIGRLNATARYIRYHSTARGTVYGHSLLEFEVYGE